LAVGINHRIKSGENTLLRRVLIDTGPLVALANASDAHHASCTKQVLGIRPPLLTCWPVLTEAQWLLRRYPGSVKVLLELCQKGIFRVLSIPDAALPWLEQRFHQYQDMQPQLADLVLLYFLSHKESETIFTLDKRDFTIYQRNAPQPFRIVPE
jgi:predicted nucleic acid-binding protein